MYSGLLTHSTDNLTAGSKDHQSGKNTVRFLSRISLRVLQNRRQARLKQTAQPELQLKAPQSQIYHSSSLKTGISPEDNDEYQPPAIQICHFNQYSCGRTDQSAPAGFYGSMVWRSLPLWGSSKDGIDCSAFASLLLSSVYDVNQLPRISADQYHATRRVSKKDLREGDLVFFHTLGKGHRVTHVGVYLYNNRFVHASIAGVQISDLGEGYYLHHYVGAGRVIDSDKSY